MAEKTKEELMEEARELDVEGRSQMNKDELIAAVEKARAGTEGEAIAVQIRDHLAENPGAHHADEIAEATGLDIDTVRTTLDEWRPEGDDVVHVGPGGGGPWLAQPEVTEVVQVDLNGNGTPE